MFARFAREFTKDQIFSPHELNPAPPPGQILYPPLALAEFHQPHQHVEAAASSTRIGRAEVMWQKINRTAVMLITPRLTVRKYFIEKNLMYFEILILL